MMTNHNFTTKPIVLVVDDNPDFRSIWRQFLSQHGFSVYLAENGHEALSLIRHQPRPSLIISDLQMPGLDGKAFRLELLKEKDFAKIPFILCSSSVDVENLAAQLHPCSIIPKTPTKAALELIISLSSINRP